MTKGKAIKKTVSLLLSLLMIGTVVTSFSSCGFISDTVQDLINKITADGLSGTEGAKILLAHERLDESLAGQKLTVFSSSAQSSDAVSQKSTGIKNMSTGSGFGQSTLSTLPFLGASPDASVKTDQGKVTWHTFDDASELKTSYIQFINTIDNFAAKTAERIATTKRDIGITEKWIDLGNSKYMLIVKENAETIIEYYKPAEEITVSTRYTTDDAKCVYDNITFTKYEDGTTGEIRNKCIPGEYYEYSCLQTGGFHDYFVADNSRGYWTMNRFWYSDTSVVFDMSAVKDNMGYGVIVNAGIDENGNWVLPEGDDLCAGMFSPNSDKDLLSIYDLYGNSYEIGIYMTNVKSGIASLTASEGSYIHYPEYGHLRDVYLSHKPDSDGNDVAINLSNGGTINAGQCTESISYHGADVNYNMFHGTETYTGRLNFIVKADSEKDAYKLLTEYLAGNGILLRSTEQEVNEAYSHCELLYDNFDVMEWYGIPLSSLDNLKEAENMLKNDFASYREQYEAVKNNETLTEIPRFNNSTKFGAITVTSAGTSSYTRDGVIRIDGLTATTQSSPLFEENVSYSLRIGLARLDGNGHYSSANTVTLTASDGSQIPLGTMKEQLKLSLTGEYSIPTALTEGEYVVVVYFATADEGIRVTEMSPVAFFSADEGKLSANSELMDVSVRKVGDELHVTYAVSLSDSVTADYTKAAYTYEEIERILVRGILVKGYPISDAAVQNEKGDTLSPDASYGAGTYRLKYLVNTSQGLVEAYMYTSLK